MPINTFDLLLFIIFSLYFFVLLFWQHTSAYLLNFKGHYERFLFIRLEIRALIILIFCIAPETVGLKSISLNAVGRYLYAKSTSASERL